MANNKIGLSYYSTDTDRYQDIRIKRLKKEFQCVGIAVYDYLLCEIYRVKGCYMKLDEFVIFDIADYFGLDEKVVEDVINACCTIGLFDKNIYQEKMILTSESIQKRYLEMSIKARRINPAIPEDCKIQSETESKMSEESFKMYEESEIITEESTEPSDIITQEGGKMQPKVKESKVKESKVIEYRDEKEATEVATLNRKNLFIESLSEFKVVYPESMIAKFVGYWTELNKSKSKMRYELERTWELSRRLRTWADNDVKFNKPVNGLRTIQTSVTGRTGQTSL